MHPAFILCVGAVFVAIFFGSLVGMGIAVLRRDWLKAFLFTLAAWFTHADARKVFRNPFQINYYQPVVHATPVAIIAAGVLFLCIFASLVALAIRRDQGRPTAA